MKIIELKDFNDVCSLKKYYRSNFEQIKKIKIIYVEESKQVMFCLKDVFDCLGYAKNYFYKFYYSLNKEMFKLVIVNGDYFAQTSVFNWWIDIRVNKSTKIEDLRKMINILTTFVSNNIQELQDKSKVSYSLTDFLEETC